MLNKLWSAVKPYCTWKMLPIAGTMYLFTNVIWYILAFTPHIPTWLSWFAREYLAFIRLKYSQDDEFALINKGIFNNQNQEYLAYREYVNRCKEQVDVYFKF